ncbi:MAG TPA: 4-oxalomesaconate tautomerase [Ilumatobacteraceae bacterium]|nr:4-oxalomesaconate tautomerase [Ilumatobacteraceae bacterium]
MSTRGVRCAVMRGGTSKGLYFVADDLPADAAGRDEFLLQAMGSPDPRQIDGMGSAHPLTSKVAVVSPSSVPDADVDYLFLQVVPDRPIVTDQQNCGNILAGVGPFALRRGLVDVSPAAGEAEVRIHLVNTGGVAVARFAVHDGEPVEEGDTAIAGVPGTAAAVRLDFSDTAGSSCGALLPSGRPADTIEGVEVTLIDNGMPVVVMRAQDVGTTGYEEPAELEGNPDLREIIERIRLIAGPMMNLGEVTAATVPKLTLVAPPREGGALSTRTFIPHRCHDAIGVLGAVSVATAALLPGSPAASVARLGEGGTIVVEHPTGTFDVVVDARTHGGELTVDRSGIVRTARLLMDGAVFARAQEHAS